MKHTVGGDQKFIKKNGNYLQGSGTKRIMCNESGRLSTPQFKGRPESANTREVRKAPMIEVSPLSGNNSSHGSHRSSPRGSPRRVKKLTYTFANIIQPAVEGRK
jgi:hypothetical protein